MQKPTYGIGAVSPTLPSWIREYSDCIDSEISGLHHFGDSSLTKAVTDALEGKGKRIRAILSMLWCEVVSGDYRQAIPVSVAYELAHAAALIQDDIIDNSNSRRGKLSIVAKYGLPEAILSSDLLLFQVPKKLAEYGDLGVSTAVLCKLFDVLGEAYGAATLGEFLDLEMVKNDDLAESSYEEMIRLKTGALIAASAASGVIVGNRDRIDEKMVDLAYGFGEKLGMAYQVKDDLLDLMGDETAIGKPVFTDMKSGKRNIVIIHTLKNSSVSDREYIRGLFFREHYTESEIARARDIFSECGAVQHAMLTSERFTESARDLVSDLSEGDAKNRLLEMADYLVTRSS